MENINEENIEMLADLVALNHERVIGYAKAIGVLNNEQDSDIIAILEKNMQQAQQFKAQLIPLVATEVDMEKEQEVKSHIPWSWGEISTIVGPDPRHAVLSTCVRGEEENSKVYALAIKNMEVVENIIGVVRNQAELQLEAMQALEELLADEQL